MKKVLLGLSAAIVAAAAGFFGFGLYLQHKVQGQVDAAFAQIRATGAKASHGKVSFDLRSRTVTIADIATESTSTPQFSIKIASVTASNVSQPDPARFSADSIDIADAEVSVSLANQGAARVSYKAPRIAVKAYSGPAVIQLPAASGLGLLAGIDATSITAPSVIGTMTFNAPAGGDEHASDFTYSGVAIQGMKDGKIASMKSDSVGFRLNQPGGEPAQMTGHLDNLAANDVDFGAWAAIFDPSKANDEYRRIHGLLSAGPLVITSSDGFNMRIDAITVDDAALNASKMQFPTLMAKIQPIGAVQQTPAQAREMAEIIANYYDGIRIENFEMRGLVAETPQGPLKLQAMRFNFANGKMGVAIEGFDGRGPNGPVKLGRFALKSLDMANLVRMVAQFAGEKPSAEQALALFPLIEGIEIKAFTAPDNKQPGKQIDIDTFGLDWGQFVGSIPSNIHLIAKMSGPLNMADPKQRPLIAAGIDKLTIDTDLGASWTEASRSFALEPVKLDLGGLLNASARLSLANVPREVFSTNAAQAMGAATQIGIGEFELTMRDLGALDLAIADYAGLLNISREAARQSLIQTIRNAGATEELKPAVEALVNFIETPGQTLVVKLTPLTKATAFQLMQLLKIEPVQVLTQFRVEVSAGL
jgi:hypothetical protein